MTFTEWVAAGAAFGIKAFFAVFAFLVLAALAFGIACAFGSMMHATGDGTREANHDLHRRRPW